MAFARAVALTGNFANLRATVIGARGTIMATTAQQLEAFTKEALQSGRSKQEIAKVLESAGWPEAQIASALDAFADEPFSVAVPKPRPSLSARDAFLYLVLFSALHYGAWNLGSLLFEFIDRAFRDPASGQYFGGWSSERWYTAAIIIAFPVFFFMAWYTGEQVKRNPFKRLSPARRWLTYMTIFIATVALLGDLTTLIYKLLGGEIEIRFLLKMLVVAIIAGSAFTYYLLDLRKEERE
jgi:hypothetical protein